jgi:mycothiol synthase
MLLTMQREVDGDSEFVLRSATDDDTQALFDVQAAQDTAWWGTPDGDLGDTSAELDRVRHAMGSLEVGTRVAVAGRQGSADGTIVGAAMLTGHGHTNLAVDPGARAADEAVRALVAWLIAAGGTQLDTPAQDVGRLSLFAEFGFTPRRSSFDLERSVPVDDLGPTVWPAGIGPAVFRPGHDDEEVHEMIYSVWTDVAGHTDRPLAEWRALFLHDSVFVPELAVLARRDGGTGAVAGVAMCRTFAGGIGWVSQLAVGRPDRGIGLGRALLVESLHRLAATGAHTLGLGVEAENTNALGLYRSVGLEVAREWVHCSTG